MTKAGVFQSPAFKPYLTESLLSISACDAISLSKLTWNCVMSSSISLSSKPVTSISKAPVLISSRRSFKRGRSHFAGDFIQGQVEGFLFWVIKIDDRYLDLSPAQVFEDLKPLVSTYQVTSVFIPDKRFHAIKLSQRLLEFLVLRVPGCKSLRGLYAAGFIWLIGIVLINKAYYLDMGYFARSYRHRFAIGSGQRILPPYPSIAKRAVNSRSLG